MSYINNNVVFKTIQAPYCYGCFSGLELIINKNANTFNASKLAEQGGKRFRHWVNTQHAKDLIMRFPPYFDDDTFEGKKSKIFKKYLGGKSDIDKLLQGTYIPQELLLMVANWISPECFLKTTKIISSHNIKISIEEHREDDEKINLQIENLTQKINELTCQIEQLANQNQYQANQINHKDIKINEQASKIEQLVDHNQTLADLINQKDIKIREQASKNEHLVDLNQQLTDQVTQHVTKTDEQAFEIEQLADRIKHLVDQNQLLTDQIDSLQARIERYETYERDIVPATITKSKWHTFTLIDKNDGSRSRYYLLRVQRRSKKQRLKHLKIKYPRMENIFELDRVPNSINLVNRMRERLTNVKIHFNHLKLLNNYTVQDLIQDIEALVNNRQLLKLG